MFCKEGLIIRADTMGQGNQDHVYKDQDKLIHYDNTVVVAITGYGICGGPRGVTPYVPSQIIYQYFVDNGFESSPSFFEGLMKELKRTFQEYRRLLNHACEQQTDKNEEIYIDISNDPEKILYEAIFFCLEAKEIKIYKIKLSTGQKLAKSLKSNSFRQAVLIA
jgi:hypothetical protein